jgi:5'-nucleotidase
MRILLSNDDGIHAPGLAVLEKIARAFSDDITIVAPIEEQSGAGRSLTLTRPIRLHAFGEKKFAVTGTPTDAVMMALAHVMKDNPPDLILSGVNRGANLAEDVTYSGTVAAAMEGAMAGIRSVAMSQVYRREGAGNNVPFDVAEQWGEPVLRPLIGAPWAPRTVMNINFPAIAPDQVRGIRVAEQGLRDYAGARLDRRTDLRGFDYYWLNLGHMPQTLGHRTDLEASADGYVTVTPLHCNLTHQPSMAGLDQIYR